jgi:hypothetical protein
MQIKCYRIFGDTNMKKTAIAIALMAATGSANAALTNGSTLNIGAGSFFTMGGGTAVNAPGFDGQFLVQNNGLVLGTTQTPSGSHSGAPGTVAGEAPTVDSTWLFFGNTGMSGTTTDSNVLSASGNTATVDLSGWAVAWNGLDGGSGVPTIPMGTDAWFGTTTNGVAQVTCGVDCGNGDTYTLTYSATVPAGDPSNFGNTQYLLSLTGTITAVPVPAAVWLFGSGLVGLAGVARRRKTA